LSFDAAGPPAVTDGAWEAELFGWVD